MLSFFPRDVMDEIWDLIESVSKGFLPYICKIHDFYGLERSCYESTAARLSSINDL